MSVPAPAPPVETSSSDTASREFPGLFYDTAATIPMEDRISIRDTIRQLPRESIVAQFSRGHCDKNPPPPGGTKTEAMVYETWHQPPKEHFTVSLRWLD